MALTVPQILQSAKSQGLTVTITADGDRLRVSGPDEAFNRMRPLLAEHKAAIIEHLQALADRFEPNPYGDPRGQQRITEPAAEHHPLPWSGLSPSAQAAVRWLAAEWLDVERLDSPAGSWATPVAVLGSGQAIDWPREVRRLWDAIVDSRGNSGRLVANGVESAERLFHEVSVYGIVALQSRGAEKLLPVGHRWFGRRRSLAIPSPVAADREILPPMPPTPCLYVRGRDGMVSLVRSTEIPRSALEWSASIVFGRLWEPIPEYWPRLPVLINQTG